MEVLLALSRCGTTVSPVKFLSLELVGCWGGDVRSLSPMELRTEFRNCAGLASLRKDWRAAC